MSEVKEKLRALQQKHQQFKQHQNTFVAALNRSREHAHHKTEPVSSVKQVQTYLDLHCNSSTDRLMFNHFLELVADLRAVLELIDVSTAPSSPGTGGTLDSCRHMLSPSCNISNLVAQFSIYIPVYPHDMVNRLSCSQARNYGGVVSLVALALDLLKRLASSLYGPSSGTSPASGDHRPQSALQLGMRVGLAEKTLGLGMAGLQTQRTSRVRGQGWDTGKPAWRPPGRGRF
ncbi:sperm acrosome-associated protein 9 [Aplochiton taeniatus]